MTQFAACFPKNARTNGITIKRHAFELESQPIVSLGRVVFQQHRSTAIGSNEYVDRAVVIIVADSQTTRGEFFFKRCPTCCAHINQLTVWALMKKKEWLFVSNLPRVPANHVVRMTVGQDQVDGAVVVIVEI